MARLGFNAFYEPFSTIITDHLFFVMPMLPVSQCSTGPHPDITEAKGLMKQNENTKNWAMGGIKLKTLGQNTFVVVAKHFFFLRIGQNTRDCLSFLPHRAQEQKREISPDIKYANGFQFSSSRKHSLNSESVSVLGPVGPFCRFSLWVFL